MRPANAELADRASTPPRFATWVRVVVLALFLSASLGWSAAAVAEAVKQPDAAPGGEGVFEPIDAEALIGACAAAAAERDATNNEYKIAYVKCLREAIIEQHSALIADHLKFAEREGADMEEQRRYWRGRAEWLADEARSCIPSCGTVDLFGRPILDRAVEVGEAVLRDFVAERNVYEDGARRFSERDDASDLGPACWDISDNMRDTGAQGYSENELETAVNDASAVADLLRQKYGFEVTLLLNPGRSDVIRALDGLRADLTERDNLLIYYAGHGVLDVEADAGFWMSVDAEENTQADWISIGTITSTVRAMSAKHVMVVSDSCYSGRLTRGFSVSIKSGSERAAELKRLAAKRSRTALVSGGLEPVSDGGGEGHSVFTRAFLTALRDSNEVLDGQQLFTAVRRPVIVNADQTPEYSDIRLAGHDGGDFLFVPVNLSVSATATDGQASAPEAAPAAPESNPEIVFWESIRDGDSAANFEAYLAQFPSGIFAPIARIKLDGIRATETAAVAVEKPEPAAEVAQPLAGFDARSMELSFWESVKDSQDVASIQSYIDQYPKGTFATLARRRLDVLEDGPAAAAVPVLSAFDGEWRGRAKKENGHSQCPTMLRWNVSISGDRATGGGRGGMSDFVATVDAEGGMEGTAAVAYGNVAIEARHAEGEFSGTLILEAGCLWSFKLTRDD